jgi:DNA-binding response OmpR family regulator
MTIGIKGSRFLVIDDDRDFGDSLAEVLEMHGHQVDTAYTGEDGIEAAKENDYDAILIDIALPGLNGVESLLKIRESDPHARCLLMTGYNADHFAAQAAEAGAVEVLIKPLDPEDILRRLDALRKKPR